MNATAKIEITTNRRIRRFLLRVLMSFAGRWVCFDLSTCCRLDSVESEAWKRFQQLRQRNVSRPRTRWNTSLQRALLEARISELPHLGQVMGDYELALI